MNSGAVISTQCEGYYKIEAVRFDSEGVEVSRRVCADWFPNLITDAGLEAMGTNSLVTLTAWHRVGSGNAAPNVLDTALQGHIAASQTLVGSATSGAQAAPPYYDFYRRTMRFDVGTATGNLSEVGAGTTATVGTLFSRALIVDGGGVPTTITVLADESLDVTYELRNYRALADVTSSVTIAGIAHTCVVRSANITTNMGFAQNAGGTNTGLSGWAFDGMLGAITSQPSGIVAGMGTSTNVGTYVALSRQRAVLMSASLDQGNLAGGIPALLFYMAYGTYQCSFSPAIAKDATKTLTLTFTQAWGR